MGMWYYVFAVGRTEGMVDIDEPCEGTIIPVHGTMDVVPEVTWVG